MLGDIPPGLRGAAAGEPVVTPSPARALEMVPAGGRPPLQTIRALVRKSKKGQISGNTPRSRSAMALTIGRDAWGIGGSVMVYFARSSTSNNHQTYGATVTGSRLGAGGFWRATILAWISQYSLLLRL